MPVPRTVALIIPNFRNSYAVGWLESRCQQEKQYFVISLPKPLADVGLNFIEMKIHRALLHVNVTRALNLSQISLLLAISFHPSTAPPFLKLRLSASHCHIDFFDAVILKTGSYALWFNWNYGLDFLFFGQTKKISRAKKKIGRKSAIKFSESAWFLPVGRPRSNKHLFIFGLMVKYAAFLKISPDSLKMPFIFLKSAI